MTYLELVKLIRDSSLDDATLKMVGLQNSHRIAKGLINAGLVTVTEMPQVIPLRDRARALIQTE